MVKITNSITSTAVAVKPIATKKASTPSMRYTAPNTRSSVQLHTFMFDKPILIKMKDLKMLSTEEGLYGDLAFALKDDDHETLSDLLSLLFQSLHAGVIEKLKSDDLLTSTKSSNMVRISEIGNKYMTLKKKTVGKYATKVETDGVVGSPVLADVVFSIRGMYISSSYHGPLIHFQSMTLRADDSEKEEGETA